MNQNRANFISERVRVVPPVSADTLRYQYLNLRNAEPNLGVPSITAASFNDYILTTNQIGERQFKTTAIWDLTYTSYSTNSGNFLTRQQADLRYYQLTGGRIDGNMFVQGNIVATGGVSALSAQYIQTAITSFSALSVFSFGYEPALTVGSEGGLFDIATFIDSDNNFKVLTIKDTHIFGTGRGRVGINTSTPPTDLAVVGSISASDVIFFNRYSTNDLLNLYTVTNKNSSGWESTESTVYSLSNDWSSSNIIPVYTRHLSATPVTTNRVTVTSGLSVRGGLSADRIFGVFQNNVIQRFSGDGVTVTWQLSGIVTSANDILVYIGGIYQDKVTYTVAQGPTVSTITFAEPPPPAVDFLVDETDKHNVEIVFLNANPFPIGQIGDGVVIEQKLGDRAVTSRKLAPNLTLVGNLSVVGTLSAAGYVLTNSFIPYQTLSTNGVTTQFNLLCAVASKNDITVFVSGIYQNRDTYNIINPYRIEFTQAPPAGDTMVEICYSRPFPVTSFSPGPNTVLNSSVAAGAITSDKTTFINLSVANTLSAATINFQVSGTAPVNTTTPVFWATATYGGSSFRVPLYR